MKNGKEESANDVMLQIRHLQLIQSSYKTVFRKNPSIIIYEKGTSKIVLRIGIQIKKNNVSSCQLQIQINGKTPTQLTLIYYRISKRNLEEKGLSL